MNYFFYLRLFSIVILIMSGCGKEGKAPNNNIKISVVNPPADIVTVGAQFIADEINKKSQGQLKAKVFHSGVLSGGKGEAEIEMCQQGTIEIHVTSTAYLANLVPKTSIVSLPFLFRDIDQVIALTKSKSPTLDSINQELNTKNVHIIAWWPRGFRQLTNSKIPVHDLDDIKGLKLRVMNNSLYVDNMKAMQANPVPMAWGEVYNGLQLKTIDGQENAEDVVFRSKLFEAQDYMTIWDYSTDFEVVLVNLKWWNELTNNNRMLIQKVADESIALEENLLRKNTKELREKIKKEGMDIHYLTEESKAKFRKAVQPVWAKYKLVFGESFMDSFITELEQY
jgi:TRAP-type transport system periplasmic protein